MPPKKARGETRIIRAISVATVFVVAGVVGIKLWLNQPAPLPPESKVELKVESAKKPTTTEISTREMTTSSSGKPTHQIPMPIKPQPVIDVDQLEKDKQLATLMAKRKAKYGIDKGIDLIVKPDESIKIGKTTVPMQEILDKIRLKKGDLIEKDLTSTGDEQTGIGNQPGERDITYLLSKLEEMEARYLKMEEKTGDVDGIENQKARQNHIKERERLANAVTLLRKYKQTLEEIEKKSEELSSSAQANNPEDKQVTIEKQNGQNNHSNGKPLKTTRENEDETRVLAARKGKPAKELTLLDDSKRKPIILEEDIKAGGRLSRKNNGIRDAEIVKPESADKPKQDRQAELDKNVLTFKKYKQILKTIDDKKERLPLEDSEKRRQLQKEINALNLQKEKLESELKALVLPETKRKDEGEAYGIYVVKPDDNLWDVHFSFLKEYFDTKGVILESSADEPDKWGRSSGVGRLLKFSELMVFIYNIKDRKLSLDLNLIHPFSKIVVFNMGEVFSLLEDIDFGKIDRIRFDGNTIWIPAASTTTRRVGNLNFSA